MSRHVSSPSARAKGKRSLQAAREAGNGPRRWKISMLVAAIVTIAAMGTPEALAAGSPGEPTGLPEWPRVRQLQQGR
ncbi:MAG: hypothetical protein ACP5H2_08790 [Solirubrobacteraceae bacterium]